MKPSGILVVALLSVFSAVPEAEERPSAPGAVLSATAEAGDLPGARPLGMHQGGASCGESILEIDVTSVESWDGLNDPDNTTLLQNLGEGTLMTGLGWDVTITSVRDNWIDSGIYFDGQDLDASGLFFTSGPGQPGTTHYNSDVIDLTDTGIPDIPIGDDGQLYMQFFESFEDFPNAVDATWDDGAGGGMSTLFIKIETPSPLLTIPTAIPTPTAAPIRVPVELTTNATALARLAFSVDYDAACLSFDPTDSDPADGIPDAVDINLPATFSATVGFDPADTDGEIGVTLFANDPTTTTFADGTLATITFTATCSSGPTDPVITPVGFSSDPAPAFDDPDTQTVLGCSAGGSGEIFSGVRGDCDADGMVSAPDITASQLEAFDGDGSFWADTLDAVPFLGSPVGCDANADTLVDAGDISCQARLIFGLACGDAPFPAPSEPRLSLPAELVAVGENVVVPITFEARDTGVNSLIFSLDYDQARLVFDDVPGAVRFLGTPVAIESLTFDANDTDGELDVVIADLTTTQVLSEGLLVEVDLRLLEPGAATIEDGVTFSAEPPASFGDVDGRSVPGTAEVGPAFQEIFTDGFESGDTSAWSER